MKEQGDATKYCQEFASKVDLIIVFGGDGTVFECTNGLAPLEIRPTLAIIPGGTCNDFSRTLGVPQNIAEAAKLITKEHVKPVDVAKANGQHFLNFWGIGLVSEVSNNIDAEEKSKAWKNRLLLKHNSNCQKMLKHSQLKSLMTDKYMKTKLFLLWLATVNILVVFLPLFRT